VSKTLVTGGAGFIGLFLARRLHERGHEVHLLDNFSRGVMDADLHDFSCQPGVQIIRADALNQNEMAMLPVEYEVIYHLAAIIGVAHVIKRPYAVLWDNLAMLSNLLLLARRQRNLRRFVFASTSEVYAGTLEAFGMRIPTPEDTPITLPDLKRPRTSYMLSKIYGEAMCRHSEVPFTIIRPHNLYGPRMGLSHAIPELLKKSHDAPEGDEIPVFSPNHQRTFCYIDDAVELIRLSAEAPQGEGATLNVGNQRPEISISDLVALVLKTTGKKQGIKRDADTPGSPQRRCPDMTATFQLTGYEPKVSLEDGILKTYEWYLSRVFRGGELSAC
jgi:nucleoside-diphosphate-sugar epimerase